MMIPYHIENWIMIIETNKLGITSLPVSALGKIISNMQTNFCGRMDKMYILNPSTGVSLLWRTIKGFVNTLTLQKIGFLTTKTVNEIQEKVDIDQLEQRYGGTKQNVTKYWPPINIDPILVQETYPIIDPKKTPMIMLEVGSKVDIALLELDPEILVQDQDIEQQLSLNIKQLTSQHEVAPQEINFTQPVPLESSERVMYPYSDGQILHQNNYSVKDEFEQQAIITHDVPFKRQIDDQELIHQQTSDFKENEVLVINEIPKQKIELVNDPQSSAVIFKISICESKENKLEVLEDVNNDFINNIRLPSVRVEQDINMDPPTNQKGCCQTCVIF